MGGMRVVFPPVRVPGILLEFHLQRLWFSGVGGRSKSFSAVRRGVLALRGVRMGWTTARAAGLESMA